MVSKFKGFKKGNLRPSTSQKHDIDLHLKLKLKADQVKMYKKKNLIAVLADNFKPNFVRVNRKQFDTYPPNAKVAVSCPNINSEAFDYKTQYFVSSRCIKDDHLENLPKTPSRKRKFVAVSDKVSKLVLFIHVKSWLNKTIFRMSIKQQRK